MWSRSTSLGLAGAGFADVGLLDERERVVLEHRIASLDGK